MPSIDHDNLSLDEAITRDEKAPPRARNDAAYARRITTRVYKAVSLLASGATIRDDTARRWAQIDLKDLDSIALDDERKRALVALDENSVSVDEYRRALSGLQPDIAREAKQSSDALRRQIREETDRHPSEEAKRALSAYRDLDPSQAAQAFPKLSAAYELREASETFRRSHFKDPASSSAFAALTEDHIRLQVIRDHSGYERGAPEPEQDYSR